MRKVFFFLGAFVLVLLAGYAGYRAYAVWKQNHMMSIARDSLQAGDLRNAMLSVRKVLESNPRNLQACRFMGDLAEANHWPNLLLWRSQVVQLDPQSTEDRLALVRASMQAGDWALATNTLAATSASGQNTSDFHTTAGVVAAGLNHLAEAETHFRRACQLEPTNLMPQLNLAILLLHETNNSSAVAQGRTALLQLRSQPQVAPLALRELVGDALLNHRNNEALSYSGDLSKRTNVLYSDQLLRLTVLAACAPADYKSALAQAQREASTNVAQVYQLAVWFKAKNGPGNTLAWLKTLPPLLRTNAPTAVLLAQCYLELKDWRGLHTTIERQHWADLEFMRYALLANALRNEKLLDSSKAVWDEAVRSANGQKAGVVSLMRLAATWGWETETEELLWTIVNRYPDEKWAGPALERALYLGGRTRSLMAYFNQQVKHNPADLQARNNLAMTALLLEADEFKPHELAQAVYQQQPTNASCVSTYAYSLYVRGKYAQALQVFEKLPAEQLQDPSLAGYYALVLKAAGHSAKSKLFLEKVFKSSVLLLPEERNLFQRAL